MLDSAKLLKQLYSDLSEKKRHEDSNIRKIYGNNVLPPTDKGYHCDNWFLALFHENLSDRAVDAFFSIYGLVVEQHRSPVKGKFIAWYIKLENDDEVDSVINAMNNKRLRIGDKVILCYRLKEEPNDFYVSSQ